MSGWVSVTDRLPPSGMPVIVSRNTWITEAVTERLGRLASSSHPQGAGGANG